MHYLIKLCTVAMFHVQRFAPHSFIAEGVEMHLLVVRTYTHFRHSENAQKPMLCMPIGCLTVS